MFNSDARKLIQDINIIQTESSLLGKPFADDTLFPALQKCMICHPVYKETVETIHQLSFNALATTLTTWQLALKNIPAQKINPQQASTRVTGNKDKSESTEEADGSNSNTNARVASRPWKIRCWEIWCSLTPSLKRLSGLKEPSHWILDSGASYLMINNCSMLIQPKTCQKHIFTAGSEVLEATAIGGISISTEYGDLSLQNVLYVKDLNVNLLSTNLLTDEGAQVILDPTGGQIHMANGMVFKISKDHKHGLLEFRGNTWQESTMTMSTQPVKGVNEEFELNNKEFKVSMQQLWHKCLGHPGQDKVNMIIKKLGGEITADLDPNIALTCEQCQQSKSTAT
ncbi:uncharacterized protein UHO2_00382 [Ustilago hordei]|uniref:uncharacterized protein n=1 Tax=Ustilago hordei TaxID=120017 RepID=UPI001A422469|nr:uncharacterized protein UHO2_00382 [Ustilago hordei]SYW81878.1 related to retrotransposon protein [Ustilago hordei]